GAFTPKCFSTRTAPFPFGWRSPGSDLPLIKPLNSCKRYSNDTIEIHPIGLAALLPIHAPTCPTKGCCGPGWQWGLQQDSGSGGCRPGFGTAPCCPYTQWGVSREPG